MRVWPRSSGENARDPLAQLSGFAPSTLHHALFSEFAPTRDERELLFFALVASGPPAPRLYSSITFVAIRRKARCNWGNGDRASLYHFRFECEVSSMTARNAKL
jgi:hypothetical protein